MKTIMNAVVTAGIGIVSAVILVVGAELRKLILKKKEEIALKTGTDKYNSVKNTALDIWHQVDEKFRITPTLEKTFKNKQDMFDKILKAKIPELTDEEIAGLRQAIAGELNKDKAAITSDTVTQQNELNNIKTQNAQLQAENTQLKQTISNVQAAAQTVQASAETADTGATAQTSTAQ